MSAERSLSRYLSWTTVTPLIALGALILLAGSQELGVGPALLVAIVLGAAVFAAVEHAEVVAHRVGEPFGSLVLAVAVTVIEVSLILTLRASGGPEAATLARDTVFAALMITTNGIAGFALIMGSRRYGVTLFHAEGSGSALATVITLAALSLVLPTFTTTHAGPEYAPNQLAFAAIASLAVYLMFVFTQTVRHRDFFLPVQQKKKSTTVADTHADPPSNVEALISLVFLLIALVAVVGLAEAESPVLERAAASAGLPHSIVGVVIAALVLAPETVAAARAARQGRIQTSLNLSYGSAIASIGLTIPAIALSSVWIKGPLALGLGPTQLVLLVLTVLISVLTVVPGRATRLQGELHLVVLAAFIFLAISP